MKNKNLFTDNGLQQMLDCQMEYMEILIAKDKLPDVLSIRTSLEDKKTQTFIRELGQFFLEEVYEVSEAYEQLFELKPYTPEIWAGIEKLNEEIADCTAFMLEIWQYLGISSWDVRNMVLAEYQSLGLSNEEFEKNSTLTLITSLSNYRNTRWGYYSLGSSSQSNLPIQDIEYKRQAGRRLHISNRTISHSLNWQVTASYYKACNMFLKSKPWRETITDVNDLDIKRTFVEIGLNFFQLTDFYGANENSLLKNYLDKYEENKRRQEEGY